MFSSARKSMPALDYVSIIRSVYGDRRAMLVGTFTAALTAALTAHSTRSPAPAPVTLAFVVIGLFRYADMRAFWRASIDSDDAQAAQYWENRAVLSGGLLALVYGVWCFVSMAIVRDPFAAMASASLSIAAMVGICAQFWPRPASHRPIGAGHRPAFGRLCVAWGRLLYRAGGAAGRDAVELSQAGGGYSRHPAQRGAWPDRGVPAGGRTRHGHGHTRTWPVHAGRSGRGLRGQ
ncbi:hypothetical protein N8D56_04815 [Devosia sp. A8/3-2]|nr:hypothetical protein N8D56_04815 [Devosia sp. A8/3-2]